MAGASEGVSGTRDGRNQWDQDGRCYCDQGWQEIVGPGMAGNSGTRDGRSHCDQRWQEPVGPGMAGAIVTRDGRNQWNQSDGRN
jgi:hypothetical protein